jgi:hypothetical protein
MCNCLNFQVKTSENVPELDYTLQGMLKGIEGPLPTVLIKYGVPPSQKNQQCMQAKPPAHSPNRHAVNYSDAIVQWL